MQQLPFLSAGPVSWSVGPVLAPLCSLFTCSDEGLALEMSASNSFTVSSFVTLTLKPGFHMIATIAEKRDRRS